MNVTSKAEQAGNMEAALPAPQGIGMAVAFDWGLTAQFLTAPLLRILFHLPGGANTLVMTLTGLPIAVGLAIFGEGIRRGWRWTRPVQMVLNALGFLGGIASLVALVQGARSGNYWGLVPTVILLIFSPLIAWRLSRPQTRDWFARVSSAEARKRHGGAWPWLIALWALVGGLLQAWNTLQ